MIAAVVAFALASWPLWLGLAACAVAAWMSA